MEESIALWFSLITSEVMLVPIAAGVGLGFLVSISPPVARLTRWTDRAFISYVTNAVIRNNIIGPETVGQTSHNISCNSGVAIAYCDNNIYLDGTAAFNYLGVIYSDFADWQANNPAGFDANSIVVAAGTLFEDFANDDFRIVSGQEVLGVPLAYLDFLGNPHLGGTIIGAYAKDTPASPLFPPWGKE